MKYSRILMIVFLLLMALTSCSKKVVIPLDNHFKLSYILSNPAPKLGDKIVVTAILENTSDIELYFSGSNPRASISMTNANDPSFIDVLVGTGLDATFKGKEKHMEIKTYSLDKPGKYKITIGSRFTVRIPNLDNPEYAYNLATKPFEFEIK